MHYVSETTLPDLLHHAGSRQTGIHCVVGSDRTIHLTYRQLRNRALRLLGRLRAVGLVPGDEVILQLRSEHDFLLGFWACQLGGFIAVPLTVATNDEHRRKVMLVWERLNNPFLLIDTPDVAASIDQFAAGHGDGSILQQMEKRRLLLRDVPELFPEKSEEDVSGDISPESDESAEAIHSADPDDIALIQFSSGSTGEPKGVIVTHRAIVINTGDMIRRLEVTEKDRYLSWMPLTHDFGIIGMHLTPLAAGIDQVQMPTSLFIRNPLTWLRLAIRFGSTVLASPNFGYRHFLKAFTPEAAADWDCSAIRLIQNGAEPISPALCHEFLEELAPYGLAPTTMLPGYGLAEATLAVSYSLLEESVPTVTLDRNSLGPGEQAVEIDPESEEGVPFVDVGYPVDSMELRISDGEGRHVEDGTIGAIEIRGGSVTPGYYNDPEKTAALRTDDGWLNTGDLGFLRKGRLVITGRAKDIIFVGGVNYYPHDIERTATELEGIDVNKIVVCGIRNDQDEKEEVAAFLYFKRSLEEFLPLAEELRLHILREIGIGLDHILPVTSIPKTTSGKLQRFSLAKAYRDGQFREIEQELRKIEEEQSATRGSELLASLRATGIDQITQELQRVAREICGQSVDDTSRPLVDYGFDSVRAVEFRNRLSTLFRTELPVSLIFDYPDLNSIAELISGRVIVREERMERRLRGDGEPERGQERGNHHGSRAIAIVGIGCRFPGGIESLDDLVNFLRDEREATGPAPEWRWSKTANGKKANGYAGSFLSDVEQFDAQLFGITPNEATAIDPQHRLLLETTWRAIEDAGIDPDQLRNTRTGLFVGISSGEYSRRWENYPSLRTHHSLTGTLMSTAAGRVSYLFGLRGPSIALDTACSSSLTALHSAVTSLRNGESDYALAGGVSLMLDRAGFDGLESINALSPDGRCKAFGDAADGYGRGEGCGMLLLRRLEDAERDGDRILGLILGTGLNHDGRSNGLTAPNGRAQEEVIQAALKDAGVSPDDVDYVEAHGTGTPLGDPQEVHALQNLFGTSGRTKRLKIGTIKSNIGHLESAAGIAGVIRVIASMQEGYLFPSLHALPPNRHLDWQNLAIDVVTTTTEWNEESAGRRIAGVSSFGLSGTNGHVVLEAYPDSEKGSAEVHNDRDKSNDKSTETSKLPADSPAIFPVSAADPRALVGLLQEYRSLLLDTTATHPLHQLGQSISHTRPSLPYRAATTGRTVPEMIASIEQQINRVEELDPNLPPTSHPRVAWVFTGQGSQYIGMGEELYRTVETFRRRVDDLSSRFESFLGISIVDLLFSEPATPGEEKGENDSLPTGMIDQTLYSQPAIFLLEFALAEYLLSLGFRPSVVAGHSIGEYAAAVIAGIMRLEDAIRLVAHRAAGMQELEEGGGMIAVFCSEQRGRTVINGDAVSIAAVNGPESIVMSGPSESLQIVRDRLDSQGISTRPLNVSHAFHSSLMRPAAEKFRELATTISFAPPAIPFISSVTGKEVTTREEVDAPYWSEQILATVRFADVVEEMKKNGIDLAIEVGSAPILSGLGASQNGESQKKIEWIPLLRKNESNSRTLAQAIATLYTSGYPVDWRNIYARPDRRTIELPRYPFSRERYWIDDLIPATSDRSTKRGPDEGTATTTHSTMNNGVDPHNGKSRVDQDSSPDRTSGVTRIADYLGRTLSQKTGYSESSIPRDRDFFEIGLDSLVLMQLRQSVLDEYGVVIPTTFFYENASINLLAARIAEELADLITEEPQHGVTGETVSTYAASMDLSNMDRAESHSAIESIVKMQLELMAEQLRLLNGEKGEVRDTGERKEDILPSASAKTDRAAAPQPTASPFVPYRKIQTRDDDTGGLQSGGGPDAKERYLRELIERYNRLTGQSKLKTDRERKSFANNRNVAGFRPKWKELIYQLQVDRADGSRVFDVDGNSFIDLTMGFGVNLFGHNPGFIREVLEDRLDAGIAVGPMSPLTGPVAERLTRVTGMDRAAFYNSGTEAVMVALRLARGATGRDRVVIFSGSYHGSFDGILALPAHGDPADGATPLAPGVTAGLVSDIVVLPYGTEESLDYIRNHANELAGVLVETVQSRRPDFQPREFLQELRRITEASGSALIFDEVITGFRIHPGGAQHHFGIRADIAVYGKVIGGGMPIGIVAGRRRFLDMVDGGQWSFGDSSVPTVQNTFVAGTFCHHPLAMAATEATLRKMEEEGEEICGQLNERTARFAERLNLFFTKIEVPLRVAHFGSLFRFVVAGEWELFYFGLLTHGVYVWEGRNCFFSTAHSDADIDEVYRAAVETVLDMVRAGFGPSIDPDRLPTVWEEEGENGESRENRRATERETATDTITLPMSSVQRRLYAATQSVDGEIAYHIQGGIRFRYQVDADLLEEVIQEEANRHEGLRTRFVVEDGEFLQVIEPTVAVQLSRIAITSEEDLNRKLREEVRPFAKGGIPLFRPFLFTDQEGISALFIDMHHIAGDGISLEILMGSIVESYTKRANGEGAGSLRSELPYRAFVHAEEERRRSEGWKRDEEYWKELLARESQPVRLPGDIRLTEASDQDATERSPFAGGLVTRTIDAQKMIASARAHRTSVYSLVLALFGEFLRRLGNDDPFRFAIIHSGRHDQRFDRTVGMFANTLLFPWQPDPDRSFSEILHLLRPELLELFDHAALPFERLMEIDPSVVVDQKICLAFEQLNVDELASLDIELVNGRVETGYSICDLALNVSLAGDQLTMNLEYSSRLFSRAIAERMSDWLEQLLHGLVTAPDVPVGSISMIPPAERTALLENSFSSDALAPARDILDLFEDYVKSQPDETSILVETERSEKGERVGITYRQLDRSVRIIADLIEQNVPVENPSARETASSGTIAILCRHSPELIASMLGVLRSGRTFLTLDPTLPNERIRFLLNDSEAALLLLSSDEAERADRGEWGVSHLLLPHDLMTQTDEADTSAGRQVTPTPENDIACLIYTSGTTGQPKGVKVTRRNLAAYADWIISERIEPTGANVSSLHTAQSFDMMLAQIIPPLVSGGSIYIHHADRPIDEVIERAFSEATPITNVALTPSHALLLHDSSITSSNVRLVSIGGEALGRDERDLLLGLGPDLALFNDYGPTEGTICCVGERVTSSTSPSIIGRPMPHTTILILDSQGNLTPVGLPGEIYIGGGQVAAGYHRRPDLTAERFVELPGIADGLFYRSGDIGRRREDGRIEFVGRKDRQVKLSGQRMELGEIESAIESLPDVSTAIVSVLATGERGKQLIAWVVGRADLNGDELRALLGERLPAAMIPSQIIPIASIPLTRNGKVDLAQLPIPNVAGPTSIEQAAEDVTYSTDNRETVLKMIWSELLGHGEISSDANFYHLGGDSIKAIRIASRLRRYGYELDGGTILRLGVLRDIAAAMRSIEGDGESEASYPAGQSFPLTPIQRWFFDLDLPDRNHWNQELSLLFDRAVPLEQLSAAFSELTSRHDALRTSFEIDDHGEVTAHFRPARAAGEEASREFLLEQLVIPASLLEPGLFDGTDERIDRAIMARIAHHATELHQKLDIADGPNIALLAVQGEGESFPVDEEREAGMLLVIAAHHLVVDAVSWGIIVDDLFLLLAQLQNGQTLQLPPSTMSVGTWSEHLTERGVSPELLAQIPYWKEVEEKGESCRVVPRTGTTGLARQGETRNRSFSVDPERTRRLVETVAPAFRIERDELVTAIVGLALRSFTGESGNYLITLERHGRQTSAGRSLDRTVGWFTSLFPFVLPVSDDPVETLSNVRDDLRKVPEKGTGYGILQWLTPEEMREDLHFNLAPSLLLNYLGELDFSSGEGDGPDRNVQVGVVPIGEPVAATAERTDAMSIDVSLRNGELWWDISYRGDAFSSDAIDRLIEGIGQVVDQLVSEEIVATASLSRLDLAYGGFESDEQLNRFLQMNSLAAGDVEAIQSLTPMQEGMYFDGMRHGDIPTNRVQLALELTGELDWPSLELAYRRLVERHDAMRALFTMSGVAEPVAVVLRGGRVDARYVNLSDDTSGEIRSNVVRRHIENDWDEGFRLEEGKPCRLTLIRENDQLHHLILSAHHIAQDGWCLGLVLTELFALYDHYLHGTSIRLTAAPEYATYLEWLSQYDREGGLAFWRDYLDGITSSSSLPRIKEARANGDLGNRQGPSQEDENGSGPVTGETGVENLRLNIDTDVVERLRKQAADHGVTISSVVRAAWGIVVSTFSGATDVVYGAVVSGRPHEIERVDEIIGLFINTIPVRIPVDPSSSLYSLVGSVAEDGLRSAPWQYNNLSEVFTQTPLRDRLLDHILVFENYPLDTFLIEGLPDRTDFRMASYAFRGDESFDLVITLMLEFEHELRFSFNPSVFSRDVIEQAASMFHHILIHLSEGNEPLVADLIEMFRPASDLSAGIEGGEERASGESEEMSAEGKQPKGLKEMRGRRISL